MREAKMIHDPVHGSIRVSGPFLEIMDRHEMQRLRGVRQLGLGSVAFPGANHTRFEHSLGVYHLAGRMASALGLSESDSMEAMAAGLLHDVCHPPFSHTLEELVEDRTGLGHMDMAGRLIRGEAPSFSPEDADLFSGSAPISEILESAGVSAESVCDLIASPDSRNEGGDALGGASHFRSRDYLHQIIHGPVDADQMDYLMRDARYTGVTHGSIDLERLLGTMRLFNDRLVIERRGSAAAEGLMVSRVLMFSSVYYHKTIRIARMMLAKAAEASSLDLSESHLWTDDGLMRRLVAEGGRPSELARSVAYRRLYKKALVIPSEETTDEAAEALSAHSGYRSRKALEQRIADRAGVDVSEVIVDIPPAHALLSGLSIGKTDVPILDGEGRVRSLSKLSSVARAVRSRDAFGWSLMVAAPEGASEAVAKAAAKAIGI